MFLPIAILHPAHAGISHQSAAPLAISASMHAVLLLSEKIQSRCGALCQPGMRRGIPRCRPSAVPRCASDTSSLPTMLPRRRTPPLVLRPPSVLQLVAPLNYPVLAPSMALCAGGIHTKHGLPATWTGHQAFLRGMRSETPHPHRPLEPQHAPDR